MHGDGRVPDVVGDQHRPAQRHDLAAEPLSGADADLAEDGLVAAAGHAVHGEETRLLPDGDAGERHPHRRMEGLRGPLGQNRRVDHVEDDRLAHGRQPGAIDGFRWPR